MAGSSPPSPIPPAPPEAPPGTHPTRKRLVQEHNSPNAGIVAQPVNSCRLSQLPLELTFQILCLLPYRALAALSCVDHYWRKLAFQQDGVLWYRLCEHHGFIPAQEKELFTPIQNRITLAEAQSQRPGFARALLQSSKRLQALCSPGADISSLGTKISPILGQLEPSRQPVSSATAPTFSSMRSEQGRIESWRDYFEASLILEREWIEGKPTIKELRGHNEAVLCVKALRQSERIVSGDRLGCIIVWCAITGAFLKEFKHHMMGVSCFVVHDNLLISGSWDGTVIIWKQIPEKPFLKRLKIIDLGEQVMSMDLNDNMDLAIGAVSGIVKVISIKTFSSIETFRSPLPRLCSAVSLSQTKVEAAIGLNYYAWDRTSKAQVGFIGDAHFENISCMKVDVNKRLIFTGSQDSKVRIFSWESKPMLLQQYGGHRGGVRCMTLQDNMIITGSSDKTAMITFRDRNETRRLEKPGLDSLPQQEDTERTTEPVSLSHPAYINSVDSDASMLVTGADDGVVRIFDFGYDLWRPPTPSSPRLCGQASLISSTSSTCVLMARPGRNKVSVGNRRQTWGTCALAVLTRAKSLLNESLEQRSLDDTPHLAWMNVDEIYQNMIEWEMQPVSQGSNPKHTLNLALHMMAKSDPPTILLDSTVSPYRFALK